MNRNKKIGRIFAFLLALCMLLTSAPMNVYAENHTGSETGIFGFSGSDDDSTIDSGTEEVEDEAAVSDESNTGQDAIDGAEPGTSDTADKAKVGSSDSPDDANAVSTDEEPQGTSEESVLTKQTIHAEIMPADNAPSVLRKLLGVFKSKQSAKKSNDTLYANDDIILTGKLPKKAIVEAKPVTVEVEGQNVLVAYDIKIYVNENQKAKGKTWQPADDKIEVTIKSDALSEASGSLNVYHMQDEKSKAEFVSEVEAEDGEVSFEAESFSIYVVGQGEPTKTFTFMNSDAIYSKQVLKNGDTLVEPASPVKDGAVFSHWSLTEGGEAFNDYGEVTVSESDHADVTLYAVYGNERVIVTYYDQDGAVVQRHEVTKPSGDSTVTEDTTQVLYSPNQSGSDVYLKFRYWTEGQANLAKTNPPQAGTDGVITIDKDTKDIDLYPVVSEGHWIYFDTNKSALGDENASVSYVAPVFVVNGDTTAITAEVPTTAGYTFDGWYTRKNGGDQVFNASGVQQEAYNNLLDVNGVLANNPTLYAHWTATESVQYTVVFWRQKITDDKNATDNEKEYDFADSEVRHAAPGTTVFITDADKTKGGSGEYQGFHYNDTKSEQSVKVKGDGSSVIHVYYDRNLVTFTFKMIDHYEYDSTTGTNGNLYGKVNNTYVPLTKNGSNYYYWTYDNYNETSGTTGTQYIFAIYNNAPGYQRVTYKNGHWVLYSNNNVTVDNFTRYTKGSGTSNYTSWNRWKYDSTNGYTTATDATTPQYGYTDRMVPLNRATYNSTRYLQRTVWKDTVYTGLYGQQLTKYYAGGWPAEYTWRTTENVNADGSVSMYPSVPEFKFDIVAYQHQASGSSAIEYFLQNVDGSYSNTPALTMRYGSGTNVGLGVTNNVFVGFTAAEYRINPDGTWSDWQAVDTSKTETLNQGLQVRFKRDEFNVSFANSANGTVYNDTNFSPRSVKYEAALDSAKPNAEPTREGYTFTGWYYDKEGTAAKVDFENDTMPANNVILYAGWEKIRYEINIDPNGGEIGMPVNDHATYFYIDHGEFIDEYTDITRDYVKGAQAEDGLMHYTYTYYDRASGGNTDVDESLGANWKRTALYSEDTEKGEYLYEPGAYTLQGWFKVKSDGTVEDTPYNFQAQVTGDVTLRAMWRRSSSYSIVYDVAEEGVRAPQDTKEYIEGANAVAAASLGAPAGKRFIGWKDKKDNVYQPNALIPIQEDLAVEQEDGSMRLTLTAQYADANLPTGYMADYTFMVGETEYYKQTIAAGETLVQPLRPTSTEPGKVFVGWYLDKEGKNRFDGFGVVNAPVYTTLYAYFEDAHVITYYMANESGTGKGDVIITTQTYTPGDKLNTLYVDCPTDDDHMVDHWTDGTNTYPYKAMTDTAITDDLVLWPVLKEQRMLRFDTQTDKCTVDPVKIPAQGWPVMPTEPTRKGYVFNGWWTEKTGGVEYKFNKTLEQFKTENGLTEDVETLYAHWDEDRVNEEKAQLSILFWVQTADRSEDATKDVTTDEDGTKHYEHYELVATELVNYPYGTWNTKDLLDQWTGDADARDLQAVVNRNAGSQATAEAFKTRMGGTDGLNDYYKFSEAKTDPTFTIDDSGSNVLNVRFDLKEFTFKFDTRKADTNHALHPGTGNSLANIEYDKDGDKTKETYNNENMYTITVWLNRNIADLWPFDDSVRKEDPTKAYVNWTDTSGSTKFFGWHYGYKKTADAASTTGGNNVTLQPVADKSKIDIAILSGGTVIYTINTTTLTDYASVHYLLKDINDNFKEEKSLTQEKYYLSTSNIYYYDTQKKVPADSLSDDKNKYFNQLTSKAIDGFTIVSDEEKAPEYHLKNNFGNYMARYIHGTAGTKEEPIMKTVYTYEIVDVWKGTTFYSVSSDEDKYRLNFDPGNGEQNSYSFTNNSGTKMTSGNVCYKESGRWKKMEWSEFTSKVVDETSEEVQTGTKTVAIPAHELYFYYSRNSYQLNLYAKETGLWKSEKVPYEKPLTGSDGILNNYVPSPSDAGLDSDKWEFDCWSTSPSARVPAYGTMPSNALTLYAIWTPKRVNVTTQGFNDEGKETTDVDSYGVYWADVDKILRDFEITQPHLEGSNFIGWYRDAAFKNPISLNDTIAENTVIFPKFTSLELRGLKYNVNGGTGTAPTDSNQYIAGAEINVLNGTYEADKGDGSDEKETKPLTKTLTDIDGNTYTANFVCWNTKADGTGVDYYSGDWLTIGVEDGELIDGVRTLTLYAQYNARRETTLVYNLNDSTSNPAEFVSKKANKTVSTESNGTVRLKFSDYADQGATIPNTEIIIGQDADKDEFYPRRPGYTFKGWAESASAASATIFNGDKAYINTLDNGNNVLYAVWEENYLPVKAVTYEYGDWEHAADITGSEGTYWDSSYNVNNLPNGNGAIVTDAADSGLFSIWQSQKSYSTDGYYYAYARLKSDPSVIVSKVEYVLNTTSGAYEWKYTGIKNGASVTEVLDTGKTNGNYNNEIVLYYYKSSVEIPVYWFVEKDGVLQQVTSTSTEYWEADQFVDKTTVDAWTTTTSVTGTNLVMPASLSIKDSNPLVKYDNKIFGIGPKTVTTDKTQMNLSDFAYYVKNTKDGLIHSDNKEFTNANTNSDIAIYVIYGQEDLEIPAPTGVNLRFVPYILIALAGALLLLMRRRRSVTEK